MSLLLHATSEIIDGNHLATWRRRLRQNDDDVGWDTVTQTRL
jgi:hypothetical protein